MKKIFHIICLIVIITIAINVSSAETAATSNPDASDIPEGLAELIDFNNDYDEIVETYTKKFVKFWKSMPDNFQQLLLKRKTKIVLGISTREPAQLPKNGVYTSKQVKRTLGEYIPGNTIEAKFPIGENPNSWWSITFDQIFYHEFGHYIDDLNHDGSFAISTSSAWRKIPKTELQLIKEYDNQSWQNSYNDQERFAEAFKIYMLDPDYLLENVPTAYHIIEKAIAQHMSKYGIK